MGVLTFDGLKKMQYYGIMTIRRKIRNFFGVVTAFIGLTLGVFGIFGIGDNNPSESMDKSTWESMLITGLVFLAAGFFLLKSRYKNRPVKMAAFIGCIILFYMAAWLCGMVPKRTVAVVWTAVVAVGVAVTIRKQKLLSDSRISDERLVDGKLFNKIIATPMVISPKGFIGYLSAPGGGGKILLKKYYYL